MDRPTPGMGKPAVGFEWTLVFGSSCTVEALEVSPPAFWLSALVRLWYIYMLCVELKQAAAVEQTQCLADMLQFENGTRGTAGSSCRLCNVAKQFPPKCCVRYTSTTTVGPALFRKSLSPQPAAGPRLAVSRFLEGITAPTSVVDDVAEKFGRPRARSLSRHDLSLPAWAEDEDAEGPALQSSEPLRLKDRRRTVSMSVAEEYRGARPSSQVNF